MVGIDSINVVQVHTVLLAMKDMFYSNDSIICTTPYSCMSWWRRARSCFCLAWSTFLLGDAGKLLDPICVDEWAIGVATAHCMSCAKYGSNDLLVTSIKRGSVLEG